MVGGHQFYQFGALNRTILELKQNNCAFWATVTMTLNRTILELKHKDLVEAQAKTSALNRTILELKQPMYCLLA